MRIWGGTRGVWEAPPFRVILPCVCKGGIYARAAGTWEALRAPFPGRPVPRREAGAGAGPMLRGLTPDLTPMQHVLVIGQTDQP